MEEGIQGGVPLVRPIGRWRHRLDSVTVGSFQDLAMISLCRIFNTDRTLL